MAQRPGPPGDSEKRPEPPGVSAGVSEEQVRKVLSNSAYVLAEDLLRRAKAHDRAEEFNSRINLAVGLPASILAAVAGVSALTDNGVIAGVLAILVAGLATANTFLNPGESLRQHQDRAREARSVARRLSNYYWEVQITPSVTEARKTFSDLQREADEIKAPYPPAKYREEVDAELRSGDEERYLFATY